MDAPEAPGIVYNPIETLAYGAARTSRITLVTSVLDALFQSPIILAQACDARPVQRWAASRRGRPGRDGAGIRGRGRLDERRGAGFEEHILAMRAVWSLDPVSFEAVLPHPRG
jgi:alkanesulfonate monooxygenase SsuD/methylene tetrahydromethanopterin reductase-like flavin-dependent oxidoreductase (luciferase family)